MPNRITGFSGFDTESMVQQLMSVERIKVDKLYQQRTMLQWRQEAYRTQANMLRAFQDTYLGTDVNNSFKYGQMFRQMNFSILNKGVESNAISVVKGANAKNSSQKLEVLDIAKKDTYRTASNITNEIKTGAIDLNSINVGDSLSFTLDGVTKKYYFDSKPATDAALASDLNTWLGNAFGSESVGGVPTQKVSVSDNGSGLTFDITPSHSFTIKDGGSALPKSVTTGAIDFTGFTAGETISFDVSVDGGTTETISVLLTSNITNAKDLAAAINAELGMSSNSHLVTVSASGTDKLTFSSNSSDVTITPSGVPGDLGYDDLKLTGASTEYSTKATTNKIGLSSDGVSTSDATKKTVTDLFGGTQAKFFINGVEFDYTGAKADTTIEKMMEDINKSKADVTMSFDKATSTFLLESNKEGASEVIDFTDKGGATVNFHTHFLNNGSMSYDAAQDARVVINGNTTTRTSNSFDLDGMNVTITEDAVGKGEFVINASNDTESVVDNIKKFINSYNDMLLNLTTATTETRVKYGKYTYYEPLTDDDKKGMTESDIKMWEEAAKKGIMNRDSTLTDIASQLRTQMNAPVDLGNGKTISLYDLGISSTSWQDRGMLAIVDEEKLIKALEERPEDVEKLFTQSSSIGYYDTDRAQRNKETGLADRIDDIIRDAIRTTPHTKTGFYGSLIEKAGSETGATASNNALYKSISDKNNQIDKMEEYLLQRESYYYRIFAAMEQAMTQSNNQLAALFG